MSIETLITDNIDVWTSAIKTKSASGRGSSKKIELHGIKKLRELILELAVRGKLVPQDPTDEPASVLLERISKERSQLAKGKKLNYSSDMIAKSSHSELPEGWEWSLNLSLFSLTKGKKPKVLSEKNIGFPYLDIEALDRHNIYRYTDDTKCPMSSSKDIIVVCDGSRSGLVLNGQYGVIGSTLAIINTPKYIQKFIKLFFQQAFQRLNTSMKGAAIPHLDTKALREGIIAVPPLAEQYRIVDKVNALMVLCDQLEQQTETSIEAHQTLVEVLLNTLTSSTDTQELMQNWQRISEHFDTLFATEKSIDILKQTILQLAVMGKLAPQNPNDEPASELLKRIAEEKIQLIKEKKIKKQKVLPLITNEEKLFELPNGWEWCYLQDLFSVVTDGDHQAPPKADSGVPFLMIGNLNAGNIKFESCKFVPVSYYQKLDWTRQPAKGDLLYTVTGSYGIPIIVKEDKAFCVQRHVAILNSTLHTPIEFVQYVLLSKYSFDFATSLATGIAQKTVPLNGLRRMPIPLPPKHEVLAILKTIDLMISICNQLKASLNKSQTTQLYLTNSIVKQVCMPHKQP